MQNKLLVICGPTSTGKTSLALKLAKKFDGEVISADSRQVYKGMDIGTGKDLPKGAKLKVPWFGKFGYYKIEGVKVWGYDLVSPKRDFSVAQYLTFSEKIIPDILKRKKLPILTGGTGLYIKAVVDGIPTASVPKNEALRKNLSQKSAGELYEILAQLDSMKAGGMNTSDRKNPRRLIRAIEIATWNLKYGRAKFKKKTDLDREFLFVGLTAPQKIIFDRIEQRVAERVNGGIEKEIKNLLKHGIKWNDQAMTSLGYSQWQGLFGGEKSKKEVLDRWNQDEKGYAKRQMVWFKKEKRIIWFEITPKNFQKKVEKEVRKWYKQPGLLKTHDA